MSKKIIAKIRGPKGLAVVRRDSDWQEYTVRGEDGEIAQPKEETGYHTDDRLEALNHAHSIAGIPCIEQSTHNSAMWFVIGAGIHAMDNYGDLVPVSKHAYCSIQ